MTLFQSTLRLNRRTSFSEDRHGRSLRDASHGAQRFSPADAAGRKYLVRVESVSQLPYATILVQSLRCLIGTSWNRLAVPVICTKRPLWAL